MKILGEGGYGKVYSFCKKDTKIQRYAIKELKLKNFEEFRMNLQEFLVYFRIPYQHPNIVCLKKIYIGT